MDPLNLSGRTLGQYQIQRSIGSGGMAQVYLAVQPALSRNVAIKVLAPSLAADSGFVTRFRREAVLVAGLLHPNILPVHDFGDEAGLLYLVMAYVPGGTLIDRMQTPLDWATIVKITSQIADGLDYAHEHGIVHRDLKPGNIFMARQDYAIVGDFGIARMIQEGGLTMVGTAVGTPQYMSPEQGMGKTVDGRSDIYALGVIMYQLLTGRLPFDGNSSLGIIHQHVYEMPELPSHIRPGIPPALEAVALKALAKQPENRYQTAGEMKVALESALAAPPTPQPILATQVAPSSPDTIMPPAAVAPVPPYKYVPPSVISEESPEPEPRQSIVTPIAFVVAIVVMLLVAAVGGLILINRNAEPQGLATNPNATAAPPGSSATPASPSNAPATLPTAIPVGNVLFQDPMSADQGRWPTGRTPLSENGFVNGRYQIQTLATNNETAMVDLVRSPDFSSFAYEAELRKSAGRNDSGYGLAFRVHGDESWYDLHITGDQKYCLGLYVAPLKGYDYLIPCTQSNAINAGDATNRVKVVARGPELVIYINDTFVAQTRETRADAATLGGIGLSAGPGVTIAANDLKVSSVN